VAAARHRKAGALAARAPPHRGSGAAVAIGWDGDAPRANPLPRLMNALPGASRTRPGRNVHARLRVLQGWRKQA